jgi:hypothetical protein
MGSSDVFLMTKPEPKQKSKSFFISVTDEDADE